MLEFLAMTELIVRGIRCVPRSRFYCSPAEHAVAARSASSITHSKAAQSFSTEPDLARVSSEILGLLRDYS
jgi:hypothetical protein